MVLAEKEREKMIQNIKALRKPFLKKDVRVLVDVSKRRLQDQCCVKHLRSVYLSELKSKSVDGAYNPCLMDYVKEGKFIRNRLKIQTIV